MAKGNMLLGHARGKVGDLVFARQNGQQVTRARAAVVRNPQTESQMIQRIFLNTIAQAYSKMSAIVDHSFEGVEAGQKSMSYFMKVNINNLRSRVAGFVGQGLPYASVYAFTKLGQNYFAPNVYTVAKGQLPEITTEIPLGSSMVTSIALADGATYADVLAATGLVRGDQLTFIGVEGTDKNMRFAYARVILDPHNTDGSAAELSVPFIAEGAVNLPSQKNEGNLILSVADGKLNAAFSTSTLYCAAVICSRKKADGTWMRSNATMSVGEFAAVVDGMSLQDCLDALNGSTLDSENPLYLNNAGATGQQAGAGPVTDIAIASVTKGGVQLTAGDNGAKTSAMEAAAISGTLSGNNPEQKIYAIASATTKPAVGGNLPSDAVEMTINGTSFSGSQVWGDSMPGSTVYFGIVVAEGSTIKSVFCTYTS